MKTLDIIKTANSNLLRNKIRSGLTILAIFVGSFTIILNAAINAGVNDFIDKQVSSIGGDGFIEIMPSAMSEQVQTMMQSGSKVIEYNEKSNGSVLAASIPKEDFEKLKNVDGVKTLEEFHRLSTPWMKIDGSDKKYNVMVEYFPIGTMNVDLSAGELTDDKTNRNQIIITEDWLKPFNLEKAEDALGKTVVISVKQTAKCYITKDCFATVKAEIVGVQAPGVLSMGASLHINKHLDTELYKLSMEGIPESNRDIYFAVGDVEPEKLDSIKKAFKEIGNGYEITTVDDMVGMIRTFFDVILAVFTIFGAIALVAAAIGIINTLLMSVQERTREIGLMKALGMSRVKIFLSFTIEAISLGFWGSVFGIIVSMIIGYTANTIVHMEDGLLADFPTFELTKFSPEVILPIILLVMFIAFLAGTAPAIKAAKKDPIEALRYE